MHEVTRAIATLCLPPPYASDVAVVSSAAATAEVVHWRWFHTCFLATTLSTVVFQTELGHGVHMDALHSRRLPPSRNGVACHSRQAGGDDVTGWQR